MGPFIALMLFLMALLLPLRIDVTSIRQCLGAFLVEHRTPMYETPVQSQSPPDKLAVLADLTDAVTTAICSASPHTAMTINPL